MSGKLPLVPGKAPFSASKKEGWMGRWGEAGKENLVCLPGGLVSYGGGKKIYRAWDFKGVGRRHW